MKNLKYIALSALLIGGLYSCKKDAVRESEQEKPSTEVPEVPVDFTKYLAIGNSLTAGYADGGVYEEAQSKSFPIILANSIGDNSFTQHMMTEKGSGHLYFTGNPADAVGTVYPDADWMAYGLAPTEGEKLAALMALPKPSGEINNIGVPGIRAVDMGLPGYGAVNPYMGRLVDNAELATTKYVDLIQDRVGDATFFTFWLGNNDVLGFATSGGAFGVNGDQSKLPVYRYSGLPEVSIFGLNYNYMVSLLTERRGILSTIPPVSVAPFFNTVGPKIKAGAEMVPDYTLDANAAGLLNKVYESAGYSSSDGNPIFTVGQNYPVFKTGVAGQMDVRQLDLEESGDLVLLTFGTETGKMQTEGLGFINKPGYPNEYSYVVALATIGVIDQALAGLNGLVAANPAFGDMTLDAAVTNSGGAFTQEQADNIKELLIMILMQGGDDMATAVAKANGMTINQAIATLDAGKAGTIQASVAAANACDPKLDPSNPAVSMVEASKRLANPIETQWILDKDEEDLVSAKTAELNDFITSVAASNKNWILINSGDLIESVDGKTIDGIPFTLDYISGNMFSMDGVHLTPAGYAIVAKEMVKRMNSDWGQTLPDVNVGDYRTIKMMSN